MVDEGPSVLKNVAPFFFVRDVVAATEYYVKRLGFTQPEYWGDPPCFAMPHRDGFIIMLKQADDQTMIRSNNAEENPCGGPWDAYFWVDDAQPLFEKMKSMGANIAYDLRLQKEYDNWEFAVRDLDDNLLAFGSGAG